MINERRILAIIPARGDSKRLPGKNIKLLAGKPMISYAINAAHASKYIDRVVVSTDDATIARVAEEAGADVPFMRPAELASDTAQSIDVLLHAVHTLEEKGQEHYEVIVLIQPTSPLLLPSDIDEAIETLARTNASSCVSMCAISERPEWMYTLQDGQARPFLEFDQSSKRSQDLPSLYRINGCVYVMRRDTLLTKRRIVDSSNLCATLMPRERSVDIDEPIDFELAEHLYHLLFTKKI